MLKKVSSFALARSEAQRTQRVRLGFSLAAAALDSVFEHPAGQLDAIRAINDGAAAQSFCLNAY